MNCRHCGKPLSHTFLDLGAAPPSNAYLSADDLSKPEIFYPLRIKVCDQCWLVQTEDYTRADDLFCTDYAYFSSTSSSWLRHAADFAKKMLRELHLNHDSMVVEIASNDGYLLKNFVSARIPCLGIEPTSSTADVAEQQGVPVLREFFGEKVAKRLSTEGKQADLLIGNNVYAHVPDINDFTRGLKKLLKPEGTITLEFPHLMRLIEQNQFDTVYHEHFSYLSLYTVSRIFDSVGLRIYDVEELSTHGGSLRIYGCHAKHSWKSGLNVKALLQKERSFGLQNIDAYQGFQDRADRVKDDLLSFLIEQKRADRIVAAYGAAAKGNTLLNYAGIKQDLLPVVCDAAKAKQGMYMPGSRIPISPPSELHQRKVDYLLILPWNLATEIREQNFFLTKTGTHFVTAIPELKIL